MKQSLCRTHGAMVLVILQLVLVPGAQLLHPACHHPHEDRPTVKPSSDDSNTAVCNSCRSPHRCHLSTDPDPAGWNQAADRQAGHPVHPHRKNACPVCQAVYAARILSETAAELTPSEPVAQFVAEGACSVYLSPCCCPSGRGPPTATDDIPSLCHKNHTGSFFIE